MPNLTAPAFTFPTRSFPASQAGVPAGVVGELTMSEVLGKYATLVLWNRPASGVDAHILAIGVGSPTVASGVAGSIGYASAVQPTAPTSPTAIVAVNAYAGGGTSQMGAVNSGGTVIVLPAPIFLPLVAVNTGAITTQVLSTGFVDLGGSLIVGPGNCGYVCASATLTSGVFTIGIVWAELPA
jgi:hypothetical protein